MATCGHNAQAVGAAAAICKERGLLPADMASAKNIAELQARLLRMGQYIPGVSFKDDLAQSARVLASSTCVLDSFAPNGQTRPLKDSWAMMIPVGDGKVPEVSYMLDADADTTLVAQLRAASKPFNHTPDIILGEKEIPLKKGNGQWVELAFDAEVESPRYAFVCILANKAVSVHLSDELRSGILAVGQFFDNKVATSPSQIPPDGIGVEAFEFWLPKRRPEGKNLAMKVNPPIRCFEPENIQNGAARPVSAPNAWVASPADSAPALTLKWSTPQKISEILITFDSDYDHPLEQIIMGHPENAVPYCVRDFAVKDGSGNVLAAERDWHNAVKRVVLENPVTTESITIECFSTWGAPASIFEVRCY
jgi:hypothetical protein